MCDVFILGCQRQCQGPCQHNSLLTGMFSSNAHTVFSLQTSLILSAAHDHVYGVHEIEIGISPSSPLAMSRIHEMGRVVYWSAGALVFLNCVPHTLPGILKKRFALHCSQLHTAHTMHTVIQCTHNAHCHTMHTHTHTLRTLSYNAHTHSHITHTAHTHTLRTLHTHITHTAHTHTLRTLHTLTHYAHCTHSHITHTAHTHITHTAHTHTLRTLHTHTHYAHCTHSYELKEKTPPEDLVAHVRRIAAAMVRASLTSSRSGSSRH